MTKSFLISGAAGLVLLVFAGAMIFNLLKVKESSDEVSGSRQFWDIQSIDTMKYSRDLAREKNSDPSFDKVIELQISNIAATGATHVSVATPYDEEFLPYLVKWVKAARRHHLRVWFRGNLSGWEGWFGYSKIDASDHKSSTLKFVEKNPGLFADGDIFDPCPECENGSLGDPRETGDLSGHRNFLISEHKSLDKAFESMNRRVMIVHSMNGDVARLIMDKPTTISLGGIVALDHHVLTPEKLVSDIKNLSESSGGKILLSEFGAPIPGLQGDFTDTQQKNYLETSFRLLAQQDVVFGINYWVGVGGSTALWNGQGESPKPSVSAVTKYFAPAVIRGQIRNDLGKGIAGALIQTEHNKVVANAKGEFQIPLVEALPAEISASGYANSEITLMPGDHETAVALTNLDEFPTHKILKFLEKIGLR